METYIEMEQRHQKEVDALPLAFAFSRDRYIEKLKSWGITEEEARAGAVLGIGGGGFIRATDRELVVSTFERIHNEQEAAIEADLTGDVNETLEALSITEDDLNNNPALRHGLQRAINAINGDISDD